MRLPGKPRAQINIRSGIPTAMATTSRTLTGIVSGTNSTLESFETSFHQDLNGDGIIGIKGTMIELFGSTSLVAAGNNYYLGSVGGSGPELKYGGAAVTDGLSLALLRRSRSSRPQPAMRLPGKPRVRINIRSGIPTAMATTSRMRWVLCRETNSTLNRSRPVFTRTSMATE